MGFSVLTLPLFTLRLVAFEPFVGLGIEAFGVLVVALLVVVGSQAVERRIEVFRLRIYTLVGLLERQRDAAAVEINVDDIDETLVVDLNNLRGQLNVPDRQL